jgi:colanic acid/amylovoran biosynthesis glycosyltransferase
VIPGSARSPSAAEDGLIDATGGVCLEPIRWTILLQAFGFAARRGNRISGLITRVLLQGRESPMLRLKALLHTWLGAYYALLLKERKVDHIHVHHGYFGSWIAMVAARLLGIGYSLTLHGSDLLVHGVYLDAKLKYCRFCVTISEYNRGYILRHFPETRPEAIFLSRLGVDATPTRPPRATNTKSSGFVLLTVGRLHPVKNHALLIRACSRLRDLGLDFHCTIAGEGPERERLELLAQEAHLRDHVTLLGHASQLQLDSLYGTADLVVLTSRSEGIPLVLMEAMVRGTIVLAPAITGIPELVFHGKSGFLYKPESLDDLVRQIFFLHAAMQTNVPSTLRTLDQIRNAARITVLQEFDRKKNITRFADEFLHLIAPPRLEFTS